MTGNYQNRYRSNSGDRRIQLSRQSRGRPRYKENYRRGNFRGMQDRIVQENIEVIIRMKVTVEREVGVGLEKDHFQGIIIIKRNGRSTSNS